MGPGPDIEDEGLLEPRDEEVGPFTHGLLHHPADPVEYHRPLAPVHRVQRGVHRRRCGAKAERRPRHVRKERNRRLVAPHSDAPESSLQRQREVSKESSGSCTKF